MYLSPSGFQNFDHRAQTTSFGSLLEAKSIVGFKPSPDKRIAVVEQTQCFGHSAKIV